MVAETVFPIVQTLSKEEQLRLVAMLQKDCKGVPKKEPKEWSEIEIRKKLSQSIFKTRRSI